MMDKKELKNLIGPDDDLAGFTAMSMEQEMAIEKKRRRQEFLDGSTGKALLSAMTIEQRKAALIPSEVQTAGARSAKGHLRKEFFFAINPETGLMRFEELKQEFDRGILNFEKNMVDAMKMQTGGKYVCDLVACNGYTNREAVENYDTTKVGVLGFSGDSQTVVEKVHQFICSRKKLAESTLYIPGFCTDVFTKFLLNYLIC